MDTADAEALPTGDYCEPNADTKTQTDSLHEENSTFRYI
jgi:hypothetical protein